MATWQRPTNQGICLTDDPNATDAAYNAGHLEDVLPLKGGPILAAAPSSGIWNTSSTGGPAFNFTEWFPKSSMSTLAVGIHGDSHVYAGGEALYETDTNHAFPLANWVEILVKDSDNRLLDTGEILDIVVLTGTSRLVLACGKGIVWSPIPAAGGIYSFRWASDPKSGFSGITEGPNNTIVAAVWGGGDPVQSGIYYGIFVNHRIGRQHTTSLNLHKATMHGELDRGHNNSVPLDSAMMARMSVASFAADRHIVYAVAGLQSPDTIACVIKSVNGGRDWNPTGTAVINRGGTPLFGNLDNNLPGNQQSYNNCIAIGPSRTVSGSQKVVVGWRNGYFTSTDGASTWNMVSASDSPHTHEDLHAIAFDLNDSLQNTLYICSDGGLAITTDFGQTHHSPGNRQLPNLQIKRFSASYQNPGLVAASTQDNGDIYCPLNSNVARAWKSLVGDGGDGVKVLFIRNGRLLFYNNTLSNHVNGVDVEFGSLVRDAIYNPATETFSARPYPPTDLFNQGVIPISGITYGFATWLYGNIDLPGDREATPIEIVNNPTYKNGNGETMVAIAARSPNSATQIEVLGLFLNIDRDWTTNPLHWEFIGSASAVADEHIVAVSSSDGTDIWVGTSTGRILDFVSATGWKGLDKTPPGSTDPVQQIITQDMGLAYAVATKPKLLKMTYQFPSPGNAVRTWGEIPGPAGAGDVYMALETDWTRNPKTVYAATDTAVWASYDEARTWKKISDGLPVVPHVRDLKFVVEGSNKWLYVATYGWGIYRLNV